MTAESNAVHFFRTEASNLEFHPSTLLSESSIKVSRVLQRNEVCTDSIFPLLDL